MSGKAVKKQKLTPGGEAERLVKQCAGVLKAMQRNPAAGPFLAPLAFVLAPLVWSAPLVLVASELSVALPHSAATSCG